MGQGGYITLANGTEKDWVRKAQHSYQMNSWNFPERIRANSTELVYVEWDQGIFTHQKDDAGEAEYELEGTNQAFEIQARNEHHFKLRIVLKNISPIRQAKGTTIDLGWKHNGEVSFLLTGKPGKYYATGVDASRWMEDNLSTIGKRRLRELTITGSHDAGLYQRFGGTAFANDCNTLTQTYKIIDQLNFGTRYFDIRPAISEGVFKTGHYSYVKPIKSWQGANGQSIASIVEDVNQFTQDGRRELVILNLSKSLNTDVGNGSYHHFSQEEWNRLFKDLEKLNHRFHLSVPGNVDLTLFSLDDFVKGGPAVILVVEEDGIELGSSFGNGFYYAQNFQVFNQYSDKNEVKPMAEDQFRKMREESGKYFLLSWTLTQNASQALACNAPLQSIIPISIIELAEKANQQMVNRVFNAVRPGAIPNIIYTDNIMDSNAAVLAMAIHYKNDWDHSWITIKAANGKLVAAENAGNDILKANRDKADIWEKFQLIYIGDTADRYPKVALRSMANYKFVTNEANGGRPLIANREEIGEWETFTIHRMGNGTISLNASNGKPVRLLEDCLTLVADREILGQDGLFTFDIVHVPIDEKVIFPQMAA